MDKKLPFLGYLAIGLMLFSLFFGGGNLIFPAFLGQQSGTNIWISILGFILSGVGLPLLAILAIGVSGQENVRLLAARVHPIYGVIYSMLLYLAIGPLFALPRTGTVSFEIGIAPFTGGGSIQLALYTIFFFVITLWLSLNPAKMVDRIGKVLSPIMLLFILFLIVMSFVKPLGEQTAPQGSYATEPFFNGFIQGYNTLDALAALAFGIIVINAVKLYGIKSKKAVGIAMLKSGVIGVGFLALVYVFVGYIGSTSVDALGLAENGAPILSGAANYYLGRFGQIILAVIIILACLTTSIGLTTACAAFFNKLAPRFGYKTYAVIFTVFSCFVANVGLTNLIEFSLPILLMLYPLTIVLILLVLLDPLFKGRQAVYVSTMIPTAIISIIEGIHGFGISLGAIDTLFKEYVPLYNVSLGWLTFSIAGFLLGLIISKAKPIELLHTEKAKANNEF